MPMQVTLQALPGSARGLQPRAQFHEKGQHGPLQPSLWLGIVSPALPNAQVFEKKLEICIFVRNLLFFKCWQPVHIKKNNNKKSCGPDRTHVWASCATACQFPASKIDRPAGNEAAVCSASDSRRFRGGVMPSANSSSGGQAQFRGSVLGIVAQFPSPLTALLNLPQSVSQEAGDAYN